MWEGDCIRAKEKGTDDLGRWPTTMGDGRRSWEKGRRVRVIKTERGKCRMMNFLNFKSLTSSGSCQVCIKFPPFHLHPTPPIQPSYSHYTHTFTPHPSTIHSWCKLFIMQRPAPSCRVWTRYCDVHMHDEITLTYVR